MPGLDPSAMGWTERDWYLPPAHRKHVMDGTGNIGPTVWLDGRVVGGWAQRKDGEVVVQLLEDVGRDSQGPIIQAVHGLQAALGEIRVTPRFPAPLDKRLVADPVAVTAFWRND